MGKISSENPQQQPSLVWTVPIACAFWIGIIVTGWVHRDQPRGRTMESLNFTLEVLLAPALMLLIMWLAFSPCTWRHQAKLLFMLFVSCLPIAFLSFGRPGQDLWSGSEFAESLFVRVYYRELLSLPLLQLVLIGAAAVLSLRALNHYLSRIRFQRVPVSPRSTGEKFSERLRNAYWSTGLSSQDGSLGRFEKRQWALLVTVAAALLGVDGWDYFSGRNFVFRSSLTTAAVVALIAFLLAWTASQFYWRWWSCVCLAVGLGVFSVFPLFTRFAVAVESGFQISEVIVQATAVLVSVLLLTASLVLLTLTHQMPRRRKPSEVYVANPTANPAQTGKNPSSSDRESSTRTRPIVAWAGIGIGLLCLLFCGPAYWLPRNIDPVKMVTSNGLHFGNGWLSAQLLKVNHGERWIMRQPSLRILGSGGRPMLLEREYARELFDGEPGVTVTVQQLSPEWGPSVEVIRQRALKLETCHIEVLEPITDLEQLRRLLHAGVSVSGALDVRGQAIPDDVLANNLFHLQSLVSADLGQDSWENVFALRRSWHWSFERCRLPDQLPRNMGNRMILADCDVSRKLFAEIAAHRGPGQIIELYEIAAPELLAGEDLIQFLSNGGVIAGRPPLKALVANDFPRVFVPAKMEGPWSRWSVGTRWLLLDPDTLEQVTAQRMSVGGKVTFNAEGEVISLELLPLRDCPNSQPWNPFPHVEELRVDLTPLEFDQRKNPENAVTPEVIGYQPAAFPSLSRVKLRSAHNLDPRLKQFLEELFSQPQITEIDIQLPCSKEVWEVLSKAGQVKRLRVDTVSVRRSFSSDTAHVDWVEYLRNMPELQEIVIVDNRNISMIDYMNAMQGLTQVPEPTDVEKAEKEELQRIGLEKLAQEWNQRLRAIVPQQTKITVVDKWPLDQETDQD